MKPKIFIGSSVEGLNVAYSIQQNLLFDAECTVWNQGIFELSMTSIESLVNALDASDFAIFVFSPDDIAKIRNTTHSVVRDNVIFEFGLFVGKLTRHRVFFIIPEGSDLHLPTDFAGITPGKYHATREDENLQAGTGAVCHQIRMQIKKIGVLHLPSVGPEIAAELPQNDSSIPDKGSDWVDYLVKDDLPQAIAKLEDRIGKEEDTDKLFHLKSWRAYCHLRINPRVGVKDLEGVFADLPDSPELHLQIANMFSWEEYDEKAIKVLETSVQKFSERTDLKVRLAELYKRASGKNKAIEYLSSLQPEENIPIALALSEIYEGDKSYDLARNIIHKAYMSFPNDEFIRYRYAKICIEIGEPKAALYLFNGLSSDFPKKTEYPGYISNCCVLLDLNDFALTYLKKANELSGGKEQWIIANIGNVYKNRGFYTESLKYFEEALTIDKGHEFTHDRMATALKKKTEERDQYEKLIVEGRHSIKNFNPEESKNLQDDEAGIQN